MRFLILLAVPSESGLVGRALKFLATEKCPLMTTLYERKPMTLYDRFFKSGMPRRANLKHRTIAYKPTNAGDKWSASVAFYNEIVDEVQASDVSGGGWRLRRLDPGCPHVEPEVGVGIALRKTRNSAFTMFSRIDFVDVPEGHAILPLKVAIKYTHNCESPDDDDLFNEFIIMRVLEKLGLHIAPKAYFLSAPAVPTAKEWKNDTRFNTLFEFSSDVCYKTRSSARGLIQEELSTDLRQYLNTRTPEHLQLVIELAIQTIKRIEELHSAGFIHGGIDADNVAIATLNGSPRIMLIDFGQSRFFPAEIGHTKTEDGPLNISVSPWYFENSRVGRRDDMYQVMDMVASLMASPGDWEESVSRMMRESPDGFRRLKKESEPFTENYRSGTICAVNAPSEEKMSHCIAAMNILNDAVVHVRSIANVDDQPDYERIVAYFTRALEKLNQ